MQQFSLLSYCMKYSKIKHIITVSLYLKQTQNLKKFSKVSLGALRHKTMAVKKNPKLADTEKVNSKREKLKLKSIVAVGP